MNRSARTGMVPSEAAARRIEAMFCALYREQNTRRRLNKWTRPNAALTQRQFDGEPKFRKLSMRQFAASVCSVCRRRVRNAARSFGAFWETQFG